MDEGYQRRVTVGQAINIAVDYVLKTKSVDVLNNYDKFVAEVKEVVIPIKAMCESIQSSFENADKSLDRIDKPAPPQPHRIPDEKPCPIPELVCD